MRRSTKQVNTRRKQKNHVAPHAILFRPLLAVVWGIVGSQIFSSVLYTLCFYPSRDVCSSPLDWLSLLKFHELIAVVSAGLPSFFSVLVLKTIHQVTFNTMELWWTVLIIYSIIFAYLIITAISGIILFLRKNRSK